MYKLLIFVAIILIGCDNNTIMEMPNANKIDFEITTHGITRKDPYYWMNKRDSKEVLEYIKQENDYTQKSLESTQGLQSELFDEIKSRVKPNEESVPYFDNGYWYYTKYEDGKEYPLSCRKKGTLESDEEVFVDQNILAEGHGYFAMANWEITEDNQILSYSTDTVSRRIYNIKFRNLETGEEYDEVISGTSGDMVWANDHKSIFYVKKDEETLREHQVWKHILGTDPRDDKLIYDETDEEFFLGLAKSKSSKFIFIASQQTLSTEVQYIDANNPDAEFKIIQARERDLEYGVYHYKEHFYITTNHNAKNFKLVKTPITNTSKENWVDVIAHREDVLLEDVDIFDDFMAIEERFDGLGHLRIINNKTGEDYYLEMSDPAYSVRSGINLDFKSKELRYGYSSLTTPSSVLSYNIESKETNLLKEKEILGGFDKNNYTSERVWATAKDGKKVPISIVYKKGLEKNGKAPLLLYGYGSYGITMDASFAYDRLSLLDRGFIFAIAHIRGGEDLGRAWYEDGKLLNKKNTFTDFIDCAEYLIQEQYTNSKNLFAYGGSAGGLLMGAVTNMRPELWKGVIAAVPFVDVVTTMLDETIPLTTFEYDEWGNPNNKEYFEYMLSYSPYDNVVQRQYPNMLITTGYHDSQVQYWEPLKWIAKLRDNQMSDNQLLMHMEMEAGHGGASGRFRRFKETALKYAWLLNNVDK